MQKKQQGDTIEKSATTYEKEFLDKLGSWTLKRRRSPLTRLEILEGYHDSIPNKDEWCGVNVKSIRKHVNRLIREEKTLLNEKNL